MWIWCLHCERCYQVGEYKSAGLSETKPQNEGLLVRVLTGVRWDDIEMCPYAGCDGTVALDGIPWESVRGEFAHHQEYPESPERGVVYPLYG